LRLLTWNLRHGGGARVPAILAALARIDADLLVLSEFRSGEAGARLLAGLAAMGYGCAAPAALAPRQNSVLIAARGAIARHAPPWADLPEPHRMLEVSVGGWQLVGVYMPNLKAKRPYWERLIAEAPARCGRPALFVGDFNTTRHHSDELGALCTEADCMERIEALGFREAWRKLHPLGRAYSWYSHRGNGFRVDHAFVSPPLSARLRAARYLHRLRLGGLSDHAPLLVEFAPERAEAARAAAAAAPVAPPP
jgi:exonuclease III